jgi:hypothetical protein
LFERLGEYRDIGIEGLTALMSPLAPVYIYGGPPGDCIEPRSGITFRIEAARCPPRLKEGRLDGFLGESPIP